jgi:uncharacterized coiled-coil DUF342 family protein
MASKLTELRTELEALRDAVQTETAPLQAKADALRAQIAPLEAELRAVQQQIKAVEAKGNLRDLMVDLSKINRALKPAPTHRLVNGEEPPAPPVEPVPA